MSIQFLTLEFLLELHHDQIRRYGGSDGVRDHSLLESALNQPKASYGGEYLYPTIHDMAAA